MHLRQRRKCGVQAFCAAKPWRKAEFTSAAQVKYATGTHEIDDLMGMQVRVPIAELKNWLDGKLAY